MGDTSKTVYLVDGSSYVYRAYHAIRGLSNSKGFPTNAIFGFVKMILTLFGKKTPQYAAIVFDVKGPTFRHEIYPEYKANRPPPPDDLIIQIPCIKDAVRGFNVRAIEKMGYEADDIIGTLARKAEAKSFDVVIVTGDKDFRQLITDKIALWDTMKDKFTDYPTFVAENELEPQQIIDVMGLAGDRSDNIPGVPGVGEKTAAGLIRSYGSLEGVLEHLAEIKKKKLKENLEMAQGAAALSKKLVTIDRFVPLEEEIEDLRVGEPDNETLSGMFRELEFKGLWDQFASPKASETGDYRPCLSEDDLRSLIGEIKRKGLVSVDTETTSRDPLSAELVGISFALEEGRGTYLPLAHHYQGAPVQLDLASALELLRPILEDSRIAKVGQNIKYDALVLTRHGVTMEGIHFDTMIASYVINPGLRQHGLDYLAQHYLAHKMISYADVVGKGKQQRSFAEVDVERATEYSCEDADITLRLMSILDEQLQADQNQDLFYGLELKLVPVLSEMELNGIEIDTAYLKAMSERFAVQLKEVESEIYAEAGMEFNINSSQQLGFVLFEKLQLPTQKKTSKTKAYSTDVKVLTKLAALPFKIPKLLLRYRTLSKLKSTYIDALVKLVDPSTGRVHTSFNQTVAATGRLSSSNPNLQNIPVRGEEGREIRRAFVAKARHRLLSADYSQVELRVFAHYSKDQAFTEAFRQEDDVHTRTAAEILDVDPQAVTPDMRRIAKAINFGIIYGMGARRLAEELGIDHKTAKSYIETYYARYQGVVRYREEMLASARSKGYVSTLFNRRRYLPHINDSDQRVRAEAERMAINTPIQGTAADLIKKAMINIAQRLKQERLETKMLLQVHDELVFEVPEEETEAVGAMVKEEMERVHPLDVPLKVGINIGRNWEEAH
jgi:DNA polymerase-1